ncbi:hypothetical protein FQZ97_1023290 [compost metagenome]
MRRSSKEACNCWLSPCTTSARSAMTALAEAMPAMLWRKRCKDSWNCSRAFKVSPRMAPLRAGNWLCKVRVALARASPASKAARSPSGVGVRT